MWSAVRRAALPEIAAMNEPRGSATVRAIPVETINAARRSAADEHALVWLDPVRLIVRDFLEHVERTHRNEPVLIRRERGDLSHERSMPFDHLPNATRAGDTPAVASTQQEAELVLAHRTREAETWKRARINMPAPVPGFQYSNRRQAPPYTTAA